MKDDVRVVAPGRRSRSKSVGVKTGVKNGHDVDCSRRVGRLDRSAMVGVAPARRPHVSGASPARVAERREDEPTKGGNKIVDIELGPANRLVVWTYALPVNSMPSVYLPALSSGETDFCSGLTRGLDVRSRATSFLCIPRALHDASASASTESSSRAEDRAPAGRAGAPARPPTRPAAFASRCRDEL